MTGRDGQASLRGRLVTNRRFLAKPPAASDHSTDEAGPPGHPHICMTGRDGQASRGIDWSRTAGSWPNFLRLLTIRRMSAEPPAHPHIGGACTSGHMPGARAPDSSRSSPRRPAARRTLPIIDPLRPTLVPGGRGRGRALLDLVVREWSGATAAGCCPGRPSGGMKTGPDLPQQIRARSVGLTGFEPATP
jgi:hypothetical protein